MGNVPAKRKPLLFSLCSVKNQFQPLKDRGIYWEAQTLPAAKIGFALDNLIGQGVLRVTCHFLQMRMRLLSLGTESPHRERAPGVTVCLYHKTAGISLILASPRIAGISVPTSSENLREVPSTPLSCKPSRFTYFPKSYCAAGGRRLQNYLEHVFL